MARRKRKFVDPIQISSCAKRDRVNILVYDGNGHEVAEWWDEDVSQMFDDGFFKGGFDVHGNASAALKASVVEYLIYIGTLPKEAKFWEIVDW